MAERDDFLDWVRSKLHDAEVAPQVQPNRNNHALSVGGGARRCGPPAAAGPAPFRAFRPPRRATTYPQNNRACGRVPRQLKGTETPLSWTTAADHRRRTRPGRRNRSLLTEE